MKFNLSAGMHKLSVDFEPDSKGNFSGSISSDEYGAGKLAGIMTGDHLTGSATLDGHTAKFDASLSNGVISGTIKAGWFFTLHFTGEPA